MKKRKKIESPQVHKACVSSVKRLSQRIKSKNPKTQYEKYLKIYILIFEIHDLKVSDLAENLQMRKKS